MRLQVGEVVETPPQLREPRPVGLAEALIAQRTDDLGLLE